MLPQLTTSAQAEGAIEGVHTDYKLDAPFSTGFAFSTFDRPRAAAPAARKFCRSCSCSPCDDAKLRTGGSKG